MSEPDGPLLHVRAAAWQVLKEVQETGTCGRASLAGLDHSLTVADRSNAWVAVSPAVRGAPTPAMIALLEGLKIAHLVVEDCWYSCPKARDADGESECCNDGISDGPCNCGADAHNAKVDALRAALTAQEPSA